MSVRRIPMGQLAAFAAAIFEAHDVPEADAAVAAARLVEADARGRGGHGLFRLPNYCTRLREGGTNPRAQRRVERETAVSALLDADNGLGQVAVTEAVDIARRKARDAGMSWVGVVNNNHAGAAGVYAAMLAEDDLIGIYGAVGSSNVMPPWGGLDTLLGTNPIAIGVPARSHPFVLDMATTVASLGAIAVAAQEQRQLPVGWMIDREGQPLTDSQRAGEGFLLPIGGYKGYGLNVAIGLVAGALNGAAFGSEVVSSHKAPSVPPNTGQFVLALRPELFRPLDVFKDDTEGYLEELRSAAPLDSAEPVRVPGETATDLLERSRAEGVAVGDDLLRQLDELAERSGVAERLGSAS